MKILYFLILLLISTTLQAQDLSIEDLWNKLSETNITKQKQLQVNIANQEINIERLNRLPLVYGDANLQRNLIIPTTPVPAIAFNPSAQEGAILPLKFATKWNSKAGIQAEWKVFDPNRKTTLTEKSLLLEKAQIEQKLSAQDLKKEATLAYASIVLASLQYQSALEDSIRYHQILETITIRYKAGRENYEQYITAQQEYERKRIQLYETYSVLYEANLELQKYIELDDKIIRLTSDIESIKEALISLKNVNYDAQLHKIDIDINENEKRLIKRQQLPTLTFNAYYGTQFFNNSLKHFMNENWYGNSYTNIALRIPISSYWSQAKSLNKIDNQQQLNQLKIDYSNTLEDIEISKQKSKINACEQKVILYENIKNLSLENLQKQEIELAEGRILISNYNRTLSTHNTNLKELWQAKYDLIRAYLRLD